MAFNPKYTITPKINKTLVEIERVRGFLDAVKLKDEWIADMQKKALILESHHSTHIEGTALSLEQAKRILEGGKVKGVSRDDERELLNYKFNLCIFIRLLMATAERPGFSQLSGARLSGIWKN